MPLVATTTKSLIRKANGSITAQAAAVGFLQRTKSDDVKQVAANKEENIQEDKEEVVGLKGLWKRVTRRMTKTRQGIWKRLRNRIKKI
jgi:hypothetical protein